MRRILALILTPLLRLIARLSPPEDPWERFAYNVPLHAYGTGSQHDFAWYFEGESCVEVTSLGEIQDWLLGCEYIRDPELFHEPDFWQHPRTFERLRQGDCEDHALWAWRKLVELGFDAELVSGRIVHTDEAATRDGGHVWVLFRENSETFVLEATAKSKDRMVRSLNDVRNKYLPSFGVDRTRKRFAYNGFLVDLGKRPPKVSSRRTA